VPTEWEKTTTHKDNRIGFETRKCKAQKSSTWLSGLIGDGGRKALPEATGDPTKDKKTRTRGGTRSSCAVTRDTERSKVKQGPLTREKKGQRADPEKGNEVNGAAA